MIDTISTKLKQAVLLGLQMARAVVRFFIRVGRKTQRFLIRLKKNKGRFIIHAFQKLVRNTSYKLFSDKGFMEGIIDQLNQIPESNGCRYYESYQTRIAIIADEFLYNSFISILSINFPPLLILMYYIRFS